MRISKTLAAHIFHTAAVLAVLLTGGALSGGEYERFHFGPRFGLAWSPTKAFGVHSDGSIQIDGGMQLAPLCGAEVTWNLTPGRLRFGLGVDWMKPIESEAKKDREKVEQTIIKGTLRVILAGRTNTAPGLYTWAGPTYSHVQTTSEYFPAVEEDILGGACGLGVRSLYERSIFFYELGLFFPSITDMSRSGDFTLEFRVGWLW